MRKLVAAGLIMLGAASPALAQFPPPGVYLCVDMAGGPFGTLTLQAAGDYDFAAADGIGGTGQLASSANTINAISGPLADIGLTGTFTTGANGAEFMLSTLQGSVLCALPAS